ncbi:MAG: molybdopterin molybdotransferase MoeA [Tissierellia bacterium]|nr:molybdopterin molybdotransferase MoeA [Tissierellia bacterium]
MFVELERAIEIIDENIKSGIKTEKLDILDALGRISSTDIIAPVDVPLFDRSPLDGFAIRAEDTEGEGPFEFKVIDKIYAGHITEKVIHKNEAIRIMTGAKMPEGSNTVVKLEDTIQSENSFTTEIKLKAYQNYVYKGEDIKKGDAIIKKGDKLNATRIGLLAGMGIREIEVYEIPSIAILSTGDEVVDYKSDIKEGQIYDSNHMTLLQRVRELGMKYIPQRSKDDKKDISGRIEELIEDADLIITIGGVSVGDKDLVPKVLEEIGADIFYRRVKLKPGSHLLFSIYKEKPILSISGNPFAAYVAFELLGREIISKISNDKSVKLIKAEAKARNEFKKSSKIRRFVRASLSGDEISFPEKHQSGVLSSMADCNCLVDIKEGSGPIRAGDKVNIFIL